jgi:hypothetical protein
LEDYRTEGACKMQAAYGYYCCHAAVHRLRSGLLMVQTFIYSKVMYGAEVWIRQEQS